jgi:hypothetical protein
MGWPAPPAGPGNLPVLDTAKGRNGLMSIHTLGIDLGKTVCSLAGLDASGRVVLKRRIRRNKIVAFAANLRRAPSPWKPAAEPIFWRTG